MFLEIQRGDPDQAKALSPKRSRRLPLWQYACVLLGLGLVTTSFFVFVHQQEVSTVLRTAETRLVLLSPKANELLSGPLVFRWQGRPASDYYVVELFDDALLPIWTSDKIRELQISIPSEVSSALKPGRSYYWMVTAFFQSSKTEESYLGRFVIHD